MSVKIVRIIKQSYVVLCITMDDNKRICAILFEAIVTIKLTEK